MSTPKKRFVVENHWSFDYVDKQLGRLRQWLQGFQEGGGHLPLDFDVLRQCQVILGAAEPLPTAHELRTAHRDMGSAAAKLDEAITNANSAYYKFVAAIEASATLIRQDGDVKQAPLVSGAVPNGETHNG